MVSLTIMAITTCTHANGTHTFSYNKVANDRACQRFFETLFGFSELSGELEMGGTAGTGVG